MFDLPTLEAALPRIYQHMTPSSCRHWPLLSQQLGCDIYLKHENHNPTGAFKVRGGLVYMQALSERHPELEGVVSATRGNHGQSIALAASQVGLKTLIVAPEGNSREKNAAMEAFGAELLLAGKDFDESRKIAEQLAEERQWHMVPSFHKDLVLGVASYALEMFQQHTFDTVYVPIGMGSGICAVITVRDLLQLDTKVVGVVSTGADAIKQSFEHKRIIPTDSAVTYADGMACREPQQDAMAIIQRGADRIISVNDDEVAEAQRQLFSSCHTLAEGAGAASLAALRQERDQQAGKSIGLVVTGANIDRDLFSQVLQGKTPSVS
ncbi:threonine dehydratase [Pseudoteredinibacter isoporae]|nr:threonine dehydratase [Pseudoteredinibacter isoporae]NIB22191.1 threonine dehydratase [Pseudoteredinibacter isoporae]